MLVVSARARRVTAAVAAVGGAAPEVYAASASVVTVAMDDFVFWRFIMLAGRSIWRRLLLRRTGSRSMVTGRKLGDPGGDMPGFACVIDFIDGERAQVSS